MQLAQPHGEFTILNQLPLGVFLLDRQGCITYLNAVAERFFQGLCSRSRRDLLGQNIWDRCPEVADSTFAKEHRQALAEQRSLELEVYYPRLKRWFVILGCLAGDHQHFSLQDTTQKKSLQIELLAQTERLAAANRAKVEFLVRLAEEIRNTLGALTGTSLKGSHGGQKVLDVTADFRENALLARRADFTWIP
jgi:nitrogen-specific signal transduction histidine kinase